MRPPAPDRLDIAVAAAAAICAGVCALGATLAPDQAWLRIPFALPLMFAIPGWAIWRAMDIGDRRDPLRAGTYTVGLSLAVSILAAVALAAMGLLSALSFALALGVIGAGASAVAVLRPARRDAPKSPRKTPRLGRSALAGAAVTTGLALLLVAGAVGLARTPLPVPDDRGYTELSFGSTPRDATEVNVRVASSEAETREFRLRISIPGRGPEIRTLTLAPGDAVEEAVRFGAAATGPLRVELLEPTGDGLAVYRRIRLSLPTVGPAPRAQDTGDES